MRQRVKIIVGVMGLLVALVATLVFVPWLLGWQPIGPIGAILGQTRSPIRLGLIHSQTGSLAISEKSLLDAELLAIEEINAEGGIGNRQLVWSAPDCRSDPNVYVTQARQLIEQEKVAALFGTWTSECRKAVVPIINERSSLLFFPGNYEGIDKSTRVIYTGGAANQSVLPAIRWAFDSLKARRYFVVGVEEVWSRCCSEIAKDAIKCAGGEFVGENYLVMSAPNVAGAIEAIRESKPDVVLNFVVGEANVAFYSAFRRAGFSPETQRIIAFGFSEDESRRFVPADVIGHYAAWNYFQSVDRPENQEFVKKFRARFGETRMIGDSMIAAYNGIRFWAQAAREVGTTDVSAVLANLDRQSRDAPDGVISIDPLTRVAWRPFHVARFRPNEQFEIVWSILKPIRPVTFVGTRTAEEWRSLLDSFKVRWGGRWSAQAASNVAQPPAPR